MTTPKQITVLLVDDDPDCRMLIRDAIERAGVRADICDFPDGGEVMEYLQRRGKYADAPRPDLIYLDVDMPEVTGQQVLKDIKSDPDLKHIPVVMLTGLDDEMEMRLSVENGANSYVVKPSDPDLFLQLVMAATKYWLCVHRALPEPAKCRY